MSAETLDEQRLLEEKLAKALEEASYKVGLALDPNPTSSAELEMAMRLAAEAVEYSSALFSLTFGLEDVNPEVRIDKKADPSALVRSSADLLKKVCELQRTSAVGAYANLRKAADYLKTAYLSQAKKNAKKIS